MRACTTFNPERGTRFSSWVYFKAGAHLRTARKKVLVRPVMVEIKEELAGAAPANRKEWLEMLDDLSADARLLIHLIIESPIEIVKEVPISPRQLLRKVCEELGYVKGWDRIYTQITLFEIRAQFGIE